MTKLYIHKKIARTKLGFTLVESLVAVAILLIAVAAPLTLVIKSLQLSNYTTTKTIAGFLTQDVMEYLRNLKDSNALPSPQNPWLQSIPTGCLYPNYCTIDTTKPIGSSVAFADCGASPSGCAPLKRNSSMYAYNMNPTSSLNPDTIFTRSVQIVDSVTNPTTDKIVFVTISWTVGAFTKSITTQTALRDWH